MPTDNDRESYFRRLRIHRYLLTAVARLDDWHVASARGQDTTIARTELVEAISGAAFEAIEPVNAAPSSGANCSDCYARQGGLDELCGQGRR